MSIVEAKAQKVLVTDDTLAIELNDGRDDLRSSCMVSQVYSTGLRRNAVIGAISARRKEYIGPIWTKTSASNISLWESRRARVKVHSNDGWKAVKLRDNECAYGPAPRKESPPTQFPEGAPLPPA